MSEPFEWTVKGRVVPLRDRVLVEGMDHGETKTAGGIILGDDDGKERGIRPRKCVIYSVGADVHDVCPGDHVLVAHGRWTRGVQIITPEGVQTVVRMVDTKDIMGIYIQ
jgi:co-chaperonin GroES (HSP10)